MLGCVDELVAVLFAAGGGAQASSSKVAECDAYFDEREGAVGIGEVCFIMVVCVGVSNVL